MWFDDRIWIATGLRIRRHSVTVDSLRPVAHGNDMAVTTKYQIGVEEFLKAPDHLAADLRIQLAAGTLVEIADFPTTMVVLAGTKADQPVDNDRWDIALLHAMAGMSGQWLIHCALRLVLMC